MSNHRKIYLCKSYEKKFKNFVPYQETKFFLSTIFRKHTEHVKSRKSLLQTMISCSLKLHIIV